MNWQDVALAAAGVIGSGVAVIHGILVQRLMIRPFNKVVSTDGRETNRVWKHVPPLLQFSTFNWFLGGLALIAAATWFKAEARLVTGLLVGSSYLYGAIENLWATRSLHPGWILYAVALVLIYFGLGLSS